MCCTNEVIEHYGVEEYYLYDPDRGRLRGWLRDEHGQLQPIARMSGWRSPRLNVRFEMEGMDLQLYFPNGRPFLTYVEMNQRQLATEERVLEATESALEAREQATEAEERAPKVLKPKRKVKHKLAPRLK